MFESKKEGTESNVETEDNEKTKNEKAHIRLPICHKIIN